MNKDYKDFEEAKQAYEKAIEELKKKREQLEEIRKQMLSLIQDIKLMQSEMEIKLYERSVDDVLTETE